MSFSSQLRRALPSAGLFTSLGFFLTTATAQMTPGGFGGPMGGANASTSAGTAMSVSGRGTVAAAAPTSARGGVSTGVVGGAQPANRGLQPNVGGGTRYGVPTTGFGSRPYAPGTSYNNGIGVIQNRPANARPVVNPQAAATNIPRRNLPYYQSDTGLSAPNSPYVRGGYTTQNGSSSTRLYPGSFGYNSRNYNGGLQPGVDKPEFDHGNGGRHRVHDHYLYYPYFSYGYYPFVGGFGYYGGGANFDYGYNANSGVPYAAPDPATYDEGGQPMTQGGGGNSSAVAPPGAVRIEPPLWSSGPEDNRLETSRPPALAGPDSLVEAVQTELANRGYFKGKVDAMFRDDTKDSIRKFQADNHLAVTGLLNNATLTMLGLN